MVIQGRSASESWTSRTTSVLVSSNQDCSWAALQASLGHLGGVFGASWIFLGRLGGVCGRLGASWGALGTSRACLRGILESLEASLTCLGSVLGFLGGVLGASWGCLEGILVHLRSILEHPGACYCGRRRDIENRALTAAGACFFMVLEAAFQ